jgi:hypothetical protein
MLPHHLSGYSICDKKISSLRDPYRGPGFGALSKEHLEVIHRHQRFADSYLRCGPVSFHVKQKELFSLPSRIFVQFSYVLLNSSFILHWLEPISSTERLCTHASSCLQWLQHIYQRDIHSLRRWQEGRTLKHTSSEPDKEVHRKMLELWHTPSCAGSTWYASSNIEMSENDRSRGRQGTDTRRRYGY